MTWYYTNEELNIVQEYIESHFGPIAGVWHELTSPDIHVDICLIEPGEGRDYYLLFTLGMGAYLMSVPEELAEYKLQRAELMLALPADWNLQGFDDEKWYWPVRLLKNLARFPLQEDTWLGAGHTVDYGCPFAENTALSSVMLTLPQFGDGGNVAPLPDGSEVNFYQLTPLYQEEVEFKQQYSAEALLQRMEMVPPVIDPQRPNVITDLLMPAPQQFLDCMDWHLSALREKKLPVEEITACSHLALFLRWMLENGFAGEEFLRRHEDALAGFFSGDADFDLRVFIRDELDGRLLAEYFKEECLGFINWYYDYDSRNCRHFYPRDVDWHAEEFFGSERYNSEEFQDEAYLFVPYDEAYWQAMRGVIDGRYREFLKQSQFENAMRPVLTNWYGPRGCFISSRIIEDGCPVGYFWREKPGEEENFDSGWRFKAGDESGEYLADESRFAIYDLNTACNFAADVLPFLKAPYGSSFARGEDGVIRQEGAMRQNTQLLTDEEVAELDACVGAIDGYFYKMFNLLMEFIDRGVQEGRYTMRQAQENLQIALLYSYACNNIGEYEFYYRAASWMPFSEKNASGCGTWYYRYSVALMHCGRLQQAHTYAEAGVAEEPSYPWGWLQAAKLRSHFGDREGALAAVAKGLELVPGDYEFTTLQDEIERGCTLESMVYHYIDPASDETLQQEGGDEDKMYASAGLICDQAGLARIEKIFNGKTWRLDSPYCSFFEENGDYAVEFVFCMNQALMSKMNPLWVESKRCEILSDAYLTRRTDDGVTCPLTAVLITPAYKVTLIYHNPQDADGEIRIPMEETADAGRDLLN